VCQRDDLDAPSPYCAKLLIDDEPVASARGVNEVTAFARLAEMVDTQDIAGAGGGVLGMIALMRRWSA